MMAWLNQIGPVALIIIGAVLSGVGAFWAQAQSNQQQQKIIQLNEKISSTVTGGDSYPFVLPIFLAKHGEQGDIHALALRQSGKYPVYDLVVLVTDVQKLKELSSSGRSYTMDEYMWRFHIGTIGHGYEDRLMLVPNPKSEKMIFRFTYMARNGQFEQKSIFQKIENHWYTATQVLRNKTVVYEHADKNLPVELLLELTQLN